MADKISDLPAAGAAFLIDEDECNQSGVSRKVSNTQRMALFKANQYDQDLDSTDAVTFLTVNTGQGDNLLFNMDQNLTTGNNVRFATVDTGQGNNELFGMNQNLRSTDSPTFLSLNTGQGANELYAMDQDVKTTDAVVFTTVNTGQGNNELYGMDQPVLTTSAVTFSAIISATLNTGQGANKLYDMDQNVRTIDSPTFTSINTGQGVTEIHLMNQNIRTTDNVNFLNITGEIVSGTSLIDTGAAGGGITSAQIDNSGTIIRATTGGNTRSVYFNLETTGSTDGYRTRNLGDSGNLDFNFAVPDDFSSLVSIGMIGWPLSAGASGSGKNVDLTSSYGGLGENFAAHSETNTANTYDFGTEDDKFELDFSSVFSSLSGGDTCAVNVEHVSVGGTVAYIYIKLVYLI